MYPNALRTFFLIVVLLASQFSRAANIFVRPYPYSSGLNNGTSWANAYQRINSLNWNTLSPGDKIWVPAGYLDNITWKKSGTAGAGRIYLLRATTNDTECTTSPGWDPSFDGQVTMAVAYGPNYAAIRLVNTDTATPMDYITIDGRTPNGIKITLPPPGPEGYRVTGVESAGNSNVIQNVEFVGPGVPSGDIGVFAGNNYAYGRKDYFWLNHCYFHDLTVSAYAQDTDHMLIEQNIFGTVYGAVVNFHDNSMIYGGLADHGHIRNNLFIDNADVSVYIGAQGPPGPSDFYYEGNTHIGSKQCLNFDAGVPPNNAPWQMGSSFYVLNNTFANGTFSIRNESRWPQVYSSSTTGGAMTNNIIWNTPGFTPGPIFHDYNFTDSATLQGEAHGITSGSNPFVNLPGGNAHIISTISAGLPRGKGVVVAASASPDRDGVVRGSPPSIGAYEFATPGAPSGSISLVGNVEIGESQGSVILLAQRSGGSSGTVSATFATANGTALSGSNYTTTSGNLTWGPGDTSLKTITVPVIHNTNYQGDRVFYVNLGGSSLGSPTSAVVTIHDSEQAPKTLLSALCFEAEEGLLAAPFAITNGTIYQAVETLTPASGGRASYSFTLPAPGLYKIVAKVNAASTSSDSLFIDIDNEPTTPASIWDVLPLTTGLEFRTVGWRGNGGSSTPQFKTKIWPLSAGAHSVIVRGREANCFLDYLCVQTLFAPVPCQ